MNIFDYAMQMEQDGQSFYERLAENTEAQGLRSIFRWLAGDEQKHYETFRTMKEQGRDLSMVDSTALEETRNVFAQLQASGQTLATDAKNLEAYQFAMKVEADSAQLYQEAAERESDPGRRDVLQRIATEERKHLNILENIFDFVNEPTQSLVWSEFSNLKEF